MQRVGLCKLRVPRTPRLPSSLRLSPPCPPTPKFPVRVGVFLKSYYGFLVALRQEKICVFNKHGSIAHAPTQSEAQIARLARYFFWALPANLRFATQVNLCKY